VLSPLYCRPVVAAASLFYLTDRSRRLATGNGDFSQSYIECNPFEFERLSQALEAKRPGLMERAVQQWRAVQRAV